MWLVWCRFLTFMRVSFSGFYLPGQEQCGGEKENCRSWPSLVVSAFIELKKGLDDWELVFAVSCVCEATKVGSKSFKDCDWLYQSGGFFVPPLGPLPIPFSFLFPLCFPYFFNINFLLYFYFCVNVFHIIVGQDLVSQKNVYTRSGEWGVLLI